MVKRFFPSLYVAAALLLGAAASASAQASNGSTPTPRPAAPAAVQGVVVSSDYVIGPEDVLGVLFWREQEMSGDVAVRPDGKITLPLIGDMDAAGRKPEALKNEIQKAAEKYLADANVTIVVRQLNSRKVFITGQVATPGAHPLSGPRTVMQLIALAGGLTEYADSEHITVMREENGTTKSFKFNYKDVAKGKKLEQNIALRPGDTVVVP
jgi:polysaccharide export outer membrane protein